MGITNDFQRKREKLLFPLVAAEAKRKETDQAAAAASFFLPFLTVAAATQQLFLLSPFLKPHLFPSYFLSWEKM